MEENDEIKPERQRERTILFNSPEMTGCVCVKGLVYWSPVSPMLMGSTDESQRQPTAPDSFKALHICQCSLNSHCLLQARFSLYVFLSHKDE